MQIGIISDTHGHIPLTMDALRVLREFDLAEILHCGDIGNVDVIELFDQCLTNFVLGNVDREEGQLRSAIEQSGHVFHGRWGSRTLGDREVAFLHGDDTQRLSDCIASGQWDLVCHGHTHQKALRAEGSTVILNPGAVYRANPHSVAVVDLPSMDVHHLDF